MSERIRVFVPESLEDIFIGDDIDSAINRIEIDMFLQFFLEAGIIEQIDENPDVSFTSHPDILEGSMAVRVDDKLIEIDLDDDSPIKN